ncbi:ATP-NAD kinase [Mycena venus]|uniref:ATP-NAD kinase n=1 Tax=Mycena venus TaxID=2733690 RepID=A0A8H7D7Y6_9AGAR|nr:ATP-NAD kinase [Mycena venus]
MGLQTDHFISASTSAYSVSSLLWHRFHHPPKSILIVNKLRTQPVILAIDAFLESTRPFDVPRCSVCSMKTGQTSHTALKYGTLTYLDIDDFAKALESVYQGKATILDRMRLACTFYNEDLSKKGDDGEAWQVMNEIALHRGASPHLNTIDIYVDGQHLTEAVSDGLIVSTPTGSTAYSLSAGGPIVHPSLSALVLTPHLPPSLSFRPLVFPSSSSITLRIGDRSRAPAGVSMDGRASRTLNPGESVTVHASPYPVPCINRSSIAEEENDADTVHEGAGPGKEDDWVRDINNLLQYNATFRSKALLRHSRT